MSKHRRKRKKGKKPLTTAWKGTETTNPTPVPPRFDPPVSLTTVRDRFHLFKRTANG